MIQYTQGGSAYVQLVDGVESGRERGVTPIRHTSDTQSPHRPWGVRWAASQGALRLCPLRPHPHHPWAGWRLGWGGQADGCGLGLGWGGRVCLRRYAS